MVGSHFANVLFVQKAKYILISLCVVCSILNKICFIEWLLPLKYQEKQFIRYSIRKKKTKMIKQFFLHLEILKLRYETYSNLYKVSSKHDNN